MGDTELRYEAVTLGEVTGCGLDDQVSILAGALIFLFGTAYRTVLGDTVLPSGYCGLFLQRKSSRSVKLTPHLCVLGV
jgi:hypothetical protein